MIGVIPAAGKGLRLGMGCKALVKYKGKPLIEYAMDNMVDIGIKKIIIICNGNEIERYYGNTYKGSVVLEYVQQKERKGIAHAILQAKAKIQEDMCIIFSDILFKGDLFSMKRCFNKFKPSILFGMKPIKDKNEIKKSYGITAGFPAKVVEKPENVNDFEPLLGLGIYMAAPRFLYWIEKTPTSLLRGEKEITDAIQLAYCAGEAGYWELKGDYKNINTKEDLNG